MSVSITRDCYIVPIFRDMQDPKKYALIARWHFGEVLQGDGSGGSWLFGCLLYGVGRLFGPHAMFDLRMFSCYVSAATAGLYPKLTLYTYERSTGGTSPGVHFNTYFQNSTADIYNNQLKLHDFKYRGSDDPSNPSQIQVNVSPNTNLVNCYVSMGGYIYDERYIEG